jgi:hypothetical protein
MVLTTRNGIMAEKKQRTRTKEVARRGKALYENIEPRLKAKDRNKVIAIDVKSGEFEIASGVLEACDQLRHRVPKAEIWLERVGSRYLVSFGGRKRMTRK